MHNFKETIRAVSALDGRIRDCADILFKLIDGYNGNREKFGQDRRAYPAIVIRSGKRVLTVKEMILETAQDSKKVNEKHVAYGYASLRDFVEYLLSTADLFDGVAFLELLIAGDSTAQTLLYTTPTLLHDIALFCVMPLGQKFEVSPGKYSHEKD